MHAKVAEVLAQYEEQSQRERGAVAALSKEEYLERRDDFLLDIGKASGQFLNILVKATRPRLVVEVGTSYGYSTLWLAEAAQAAGGRLVSLEMSETKIGFARQRIAEAGLAPVVEFLHGDAIANLASLKEEVDFALIDLWKEQYIPALDALRPRLADGALIAADNICLPAIHAPAMQAYVSHVRSLPEMQSVTVPVGSGIELTRYSKP